MIALLPLLLAAAPQSSAAPASDQAEWITVADYPAAAIRAGAQGNTAVDLEIGTDGRVTSCRIVESAGMAALDEAACTALRARAHFRPPVDASGTAVVSHYRRRIAWRLPQTPTHMTVTALLHRDGSVEDCRMTIDGAPPRDASICTMLPQMFEVLFARQADGSVRRDLVAIMDMREDRGAAAIGAPAPPPPGIVMLQRTVSFTVMPDGRVTDCHAKVESDWSWFGSNPCRDAKAAGFGGTAAPGTPVEVRRTLTVAYRNAPARR